MVERKRWLAPVLPDRLKFYLGGFLAIEKAQRLAFAIAAAAFLQCLNAPFFGVHRREP